MTDEDLIATCVWSEAANQPYEGMVAVARVIYNRSAVHYMGAQTPGDVIRQPLQFSGFWFDFVDGKYTRVAWTVEEFEARAISMMAKGQTQPKAWSQAQQTVLDGQIGSAFAGGPQWQKLNAEPRTLLYLNPRIVDPLPAWATPEAQVAVIYDHTFYRG